MVGTPADEYLRSLGTIKRMSDVKPWDLIIMGAGTAGLTAAIFAGQRGGRTLLVEASPELGGSLLVSHGQISAAGTRLQAEKGIADSPEQHFEDAIRISKGTIDQDLARLAIFNAGLTFDWLMDNGYEVLPQCPVLAGVHEPYRVARYYWGKELGRSIAKVLVKCIREQIERGTVTLQTSTRVVSLLQEPDRAVRGVETEDSEGLRRCVPGKKVLLASGGYAANPDLFRQLCGVPLFARAAYRYDLGAGLELGIAAGGYARGREKYLCNFGWILEDDRFPSAITGRANTQPESRPPWEIYVNADGRRFIREDETSVDVREHALLKQPDLRYWIVFDQRIFERAPPIVYDWSREQMLQAFNGHAMFRQAATLEELARATGLDALALRQTVDDYNTGRAAGRDVFGRQHMPAAIESGSFYAIRLQGGSVTSTVGLAVDRQLRVIRRDGAPVPNLYAAGEILGSGQLQGDAFVGGMMAMPALVFGRLLGEWMIPF
jgi:fumarate reductase flavoprotein subunit